jgi:lipopolysaccharide export system protein LptA
LRFAFVFLAIVIPLTALVWWLEGDLEPPAPLPDTPPESGAPVLEGREITGGEFSGRILKLEGVELRLVEGADIKAYAKFGGLRRGEDGQPRLEEVLVGLFDEGKLVFTIASPWVSGDVEPLLRPGSGARVIDFGGGVTLHDAGGREVARADALRYDVDKNTLHSDDHVLLRLAERGADVEGDGLFAQLDAEDRFVRLERDVIGRAPTERGTARFRCSGPATIRETSKDVYELALAGDARIDHPLATARCPRMEAIVRRGEKEHRLERAELFGGVEIGIGRDVKGGLEKLRADRVVIAGENRVTLTGEFRAIRRGPMRRLGLGDRTLDIEANEALLERVDAEKDLFRIVLVRTRVTDRLGAGSFRAERVEYDQRSGRFVASGDVRAKVPDGSLRAERLEAVERGEEDLDLVVEGKDKEIAHAADGKLGPLGEGRRGDLVIRAAGPLRVERRPERVRFRASKDVRISLGGTAKLTCDEIQVLQAGDRLQAFTARGDVVVVEPDRGMRIVGDELVYDGDKGEARLRGAPARVRSKEHGNVTGTTITYRDDGGFAARGSPATVDARLVRGKATEIWKIRALRISGVMRDDKTPRSIRAMEQVAVAGPAGESFTGTDLAYDGDKGEALLAGKPAVAARGDEVSLEAPRIVLTLRDDKVERARTDGKALVRLRTKGSRDALQVDSWTFTLDGPARFSGDRLVIAKGGALKGLSPKGDLLLEGRAGRVEIDIERVGGRLAAKRLRGLNGVELASHGKDPVKVTAKTLGYRLRSKEVELEGDVAVKAEGYDPKLRFRRAVFVVTKDGVDFKSASDVEVSERN